jgi:hypothetical protein
MKTLSQGLRVFLLIGIASARGADAPSTVSGVVLAADTGQPISNALVRVASPAMDLRGEQGPAQTIFDGRTEVTGHFSIPAPFHPKISLNAFAPGYRELAGMWMDGNWGFHDVPFPTNASQQFTMHLHPALYVSGTVTDDSGKPVPWVGVEATMCGADYYAYVSNGTTDEAGRFEVFDFPKKPEDFGDGHARAQLIFRGPAKLTYTVTNLYAVTEAARTNLQITLSSGHSIRGTIRSIAGAPAAAEVIVEAVPTDERAATRTTRADEQGRYFMAGLPDGEITVQAHTPKFDLNGRQTVKLAGKDLEINLPLSPVVYAHPPKVVRLLGMDLADMNAELQSVYSLWKPTGVLILDPGTNYLRLGIGELRQGECFWRVGNKEVRNLKEMAAELLRIDALPHSVAPNEGSHGGVRIVYWFRNHGGTMTQYIQLSEADVWELKRY